MKKILQSFFIAILALTAATSVAVAAISIVPNGGTGVGTITGLIKGNGTSPFTAATPGTDFQSPISLTTTGTSGAATFTSNVLNIPQYSGGTVPGGLNTQLEYNNAGAFGGITGAVTDGTSVSLTTPHFLNPTINGAGTGLATLTYPNTSTSVSIAFPATAGTLALTSQLTSGTVTGTGSATQIAYWSGTSAITGNNNLWWDNTDTRLGVGTNTPRTSLDLKTSVPNGGVLSLQNTASNGYSSADIYDDLSNKVAGFGVGGSTTGAPLKGNFYLGTNATADVVFLTNSIEAGRFIGSNQTLKLASLTTGLVKSTSGILSNAASTDFAASVSNADGTLTISPTTGAVVASLALGHANTWSALQTFGANLTLNSASPILRLNDTGQTTPAGVFTVRSDSNNLQFFSGVLGSSAAETLAISGNGTPNAVTVNMLQVQPVSLGLFTGTNVTLFPVSGSSYINNGGSLGIGTTTPNYGGYSGTGLTLGGTAAPFLEFNRAITAGGSSIGIFRAGDTTGSSLVGLQFMTGSTGGTGAIQIQTYNGSSLVSGISMDENQIVTLTGTLDLRAGSATASNSPLKFTLGTLLTTPEAGAEEFDGKAFYATATASARELIPATQFTNLSSDFTLSNVATVQNAFPTPGSTFNVNAGTTYKFDGKYFVTNGGTSNGLMVGFGGTGTVSSITWSALGYKAQPNVSGGVTAQTSEWMTSVTPILMMVASTNTGAYVEFSGTVRFSASGTFIPEVQFSAAPGGTNLMKVNSYFNIIPLGFDTVQSVGNIS